MALSSSDIDDLRTAKNLLDNPGFAAKLSDVVGAPIEKGFKMLPKKWSDVVNHATRRSIEAALDVALWTLDHSQPEPPSNWRHKFAALTAGAAGGASVCPHLRWSSPYPPRLCSGQSQTSHAARVKT